MPAPAKVWNKQECNGTPLQDYIYLFGSPGLSCSMQGL